MGDKLLLKLNIYGKPIANKYCEGKMKRTLKRGLKDLKSLKRKQLKKLSDCDNANLAGLSWLQFFIGCIGLCSLYWFIAVRRQNELLYIINTRRTPLGLPWSLRWILYHCNWGFPLWRFCRNGFNWPVLKHGPRSLTRMRVCGCKNPYAQRK